MPEAHEILSAIAAQSLNLAEGEFQELVMDPENEGKFKDNAVELLLDVDKKRVSKLKAEGGDPAKVKEINDNFYKKGRKEALSELESKIKGDYNLESELTGMELVGSLVDTIKSSSKNPAPTDDDIKRHRVYQDAKAQYESKLKEQDEAWGNKLKEINDAHASEKTFGIVKDKAMGLVKGMNPILPKDQTKAANQLNLVVQALSADQFEVQGDRILILDKEGKIKQNDLGHDINFDEHVKGIAESYFEFEQAKPRTSSKEKGASGGADPGNDNTPKKWTGAIPKTDEEYMKIMGEQTTSEDRIALKEAYSASKQPT